MLFPSPIPKSVPNSVQLFTGTNWKQPPISGLFLIPILKVRTASCAKRVRLRQDDPPVSSVSPGEPPRGVAASTSTWYRLGKSVEISNRRSVRRIGDGNRAGPRVHALKKRIDLPVGSLHDGGAVTEEGALVAQAAQSMRREPGLFVRVVHSPWRHPHTALIVQDVTGKEGRFGR